MASLKLNTASGGSITLNPQNTASNITVTVPNSDSTLLTASDIGSTVQAYDADILTASDIGSTVQAYDTDLTTWAGKTAPTGTVVGTSDTQTLTNKTFTSPSITTPIITGNREVKVALAANDIDLATGNFFSKIITTATTFTVSNVPTSGVTGSFVLDLTNGGAYTITWWSNLKWANGVSPTLTVTGRDVLGFFTHDNGTTWTGLVLGKDIK